MKSEAPECRKTSAGWRRTTWLGSGLGLGLGLRRRAPGGGAGVRVVRGFVAPPAAATILHQLLKGCCCCSCCSCCCALLPLCCSASRCCGAERDVRRGREGSPSVPGGTEGDVRASERAALFCAASICGRMTRAGVGCYRGRGAQSYHAPPHAPRGPPAGPRPRPPPTRGRCVRFGPVAPLGRGHAGDRRAGGPFLHFAAALQAYTGACGAAGRRPRAPGAARRWGSRMQCEWVPCVGSPCNGTL